MMDLPLSRTRPTHSCFFFWVAYADTPTVGDRFSTTKLDLLFFVLSNHCLMCVEAIFLNNPNEDNHYMFLGLFFVTQGKY